MIIMDFIKEVLNIMAMVYVTLILKGKKRLSQVPNIIKSQVEEILKVTLEVEEIPEELK